MPTERDRDIEGIRLEKETWMERRPQTEGEKLIWFKVLSIKRQVSNCLEVGE